MAAPCYLFPCTGLALRFLALQGHFSQQVTHSPQWTGGSRAVLPKTHSSFPTGLGGYFFLRASSTTFLVLHLSRMSPKLRKLHTTSSPTGPAGGTCEWSWPLRLAQSTVLAWVPEKARDKGSSWLQGLHLGVWFQGSLSKTGKEESLWDDVLLSV